jgi:hypothetical protein
MTLAAARRSCPRAVALRCEAGDPRLGIRQRSESLLGLLCTRLSAPYSQSTNRARVQTMRYDPAPIALHCDCQHPEGGVFLRAYR